MGSDAMLERLSGFISSKLSVGFIGSWMLVAQWDRVHPYPHGSGAAVSEEYGDFLESVSIILHILLEQLTYLVFIANRRTRFKQWS